MTNIPQVSPGAETIAVSNRQDQPQQSFGATQTAPYPNDSFTTTMQAPKSSQGPWKVLAGVSTAAAGTFAALFAHGKTAAGKNTKAIHGILQVVGEKIPKTIGECISKLSEITTVDALSGLKNRRTFDAALNKHFTESVSGKKPMHMAMLDMDFFKSVNDVLGHQKGDEFLAMISHNINEVSNAHNVSAFRYGGEEFAVLMPGHDAEASQKIVQEIADKIKADPKIQSHQEAFLKKANEDLEKFKAEKKSYSEFWQKIRTPKENQHNLAAECLKLLGENPKAKTDAEQQSLEEAIKKLEQIRDKKSKSKVHDVILEHRPLTLALNETNNKDKEITAYERWISHVKNNGFTISAGVGGLSHLPEDAKPEDLLALADGTLQSAKQHRNTVLAAK